MIEEADHLTLETSVQVTSSPKSFVTCETLIDSGATSCFVDAAFVKKHQLHTTQLPKPKALELAVESSKSAITHIATFPIVIGMHTEQVTCYVAPKLSYPIILGISWMTRHNVRPDWRTRSVVFSPEVCGAECLPCREPCTVFSQRTPVPKEVFIDGVSCKTVGLTEFCELIQETESEAVVFLPKDTREECEDQEPHSLNCSSLRSAAINPADFDKFMKGKDKSDPLEKLPKWLHDYLDVFSKDQADKLPEHTDHDHEINIESNGKPIPFKRPYGATREELEVSKKYVDDHLAKGFVRPSTSSAASPVILVKKPGGGLRFCVDYRALNAITIKNRYPIPRVKETLDRLCKAKYYTKLDIIAAFNAVRIKKGHEWLTAFTTRYGQFEYLVMPFGLCNAPSTFQKHINNALQNILDIYCTAYLDDILIYSETRQQHRQHVREVLKRLRKAKLHVDIDKCEFETDKVKYLGLIVTTDEGIQMDPEKIRTMQEWPVPRTVKDVLAFLGFANFYRRMVRNFGKIALPLTELTRNQDKEKTAKARLPLNWTASCQRSFQALKDAFASDPIVQHFDYEKESHVEVDASDGVLGGILSQQDKDGNLKPVAYFSKRMSPAECNYEIYDKELLAIVRAFEEWRPELASTDPTHPVNVLSDHRSLEYFMTTKELNRRQARWSEFLSEFQFKITYRPGKQGTKPDALTRRAGEGPTSKNEQVLLKPVNLGQGVLPAAQTTHCAQLAAMVVEEELDLEDMITNAYDNDALVNSVMTALRNNEKAPSKFKDKLQLAGVSLSQCEIRGERLYFDNRLWIPEDDDLILAVIKAHHDAPGAGHPGRERTFQLLKANYFWPGMMTSVRQFTRTCHTCRRSKAFRNAYSGSLHQLNVPDDPFRHIAVDFVVDLPPSVADDGVEYRNILTITDRLTKLRHYVPCNDMDAISTAKMFYRHVYARFGIPETVVSDRGTQFTSLFMKRLYERLQIKRSLSTAFHPESDGQSENSNQIMEQYLRAYTNWLQTDWAEWLPAAEFAANNHVSETTKVTPFYAAYGFHPRWGVEPPSPLPPTVARAKLEADSADKFAQRMEELHEHLKTQMTYAQGCYEQAVAKTRSPAPRYSIGDKVWLDARHVKTERPSKKLDHKNLGPYAIVEQIHPNAYRLKLDEQMRIHDVFHTSLLRPVANDPLPGQLEAEEPPPLYVVRNNESNEEYEVEEVLDSQRIGKKKRLRYKMRWKGYTPDWRTWEEVLPGCDDLIQEFHAKHPAKPGPPSDKEYNFETQEVLQVSGGVAPRRPRKK